MQTNPADKLCLQKIRQKLGQNADKSCRQTLSAKNPPKPGSKCRQILQTNLVKTDNCRQLQKKCRQGLSSIVRKGLSILDKLCLYPKILELALKTSRSSAPQNRRCSDKTFLNFKQYEDSQRELCSARETYCPASYTPTPSCRPLNA